MSNSNYFIGVDIGGTNTRIAAVSPAYDVLQKRHFETASYPSGSGFLSELSFQLNDLIGELAGQLQGIGLGAPCGNYHTGIIEAPANIEWERPLNIKKVLSQIYGVNVTVTNDANLSALGEKAMGKAKKLSNFISITIGTGLGAGIYVDDHLLHGNAGFAGEVGHMVVERNGRLCKCGRRGCLETYVSASGIIRSYLKELACQSIDMNLIKSRLENISAHKIGEEANAGDQLAIKTLALTGDILGKSLADLAIAYAPEAIFLSGGPVGAGDFLMKPAKESFELNLIKHLRGKVNLDYSLSQSNELALIGAAALAMNNQQLVMEKTL